MTPLGGKQEKSKMLQASYIASGAFMSLLSQATSRHLRPTSLSPLNPITLTTRSKCCGTIETQRLNAPYPKQTAPYTLAKVSESFSFAVFVLPESWFVLCGERNKTRITAPTTYSNKLVNCTRLSHPQHQTT